MPIATPEQLSKLAPYIAGATPDERGEIEMHCPIHGDAKRSASVNPGKGVWFCHAGCGGGSIRQLVGGEDAWKPVPLEAKRAMMVRRNPSKVETYDMEDVERWKFKLLDSAAKVDQLWERKGITMETMIKALLGHNGSYYKIPVFSTEREILNVRTYDMDPASGRRKIWSVKGMGQAQLYPIGPLTRTVKHQNVLFTEGEWDTLMALQAGYTAVTRTDGAGKPWHDEWTEYFEDRRVILCPDRDTPGIEGAERIYEALKGVAQSVKFANLPHEITKKDGYDLSDYLMERSRPDWYLVGNLMADATTKIQETV